jgi:hypothetical protein
MQSSTKKTESLKADESVATVSQETTPVEGDNITDVMQTFASSYDVSYTSFDMCMKSLLSRGVNDLNKAPPPRANQTESSSVSSVRPFWHTCVTKFHTAYLKAFRQSAAFKKMMMVFFDMYSEELCKPLFTEDGDSVADGFFKRTDRFPGPLSAAARTASASATGTSSVLEGPVVYFDMVSSQLASVCIPIGEMYRAAIKQYLSAPSSNLKKKLLPTLTLLDFYAVIYHSMDGSHPSREYVERNLADLCEAAEAVSPGSGPGSSSLSSGGGSYPLDSSSSSNLFSGNPFEALTKMFSGASTPESNGGLEGAFGSIAGIVSSLAAVGGVNPNVAGDMTTAIKSVGTSVKTLVDKLSEIKKEGGDGSGDSSSMPIDNEQFVEALGAIFQSGEVKQQLSQTLKTASAVFGALTGNDSNVTESSSSEIERSSGSVEEITE